MLELHYRGPTQVTVRIVTVSESQAINIAVGLIVCCPIIQESANASALCTGELMIAGETGLKHTRPP